MPDRERALGEQAGLLAQMTRALAQCCVAKESEIFNRFGLTTGEGNVLLAVADGTSSPSALAGQLGVARSRITPLVQNLVNKGFVKRTESHQDRRVRDLKLTSQGEGVAQEALRFRLSFHSRLLGKFEREERGPLLDTLAQLHEKMMEVRKGMITNKPES